MPQHSIRMPCSPVCLSPNCCQLSAPQQAHVHQQGGQDIKDGGDNQDACFLHLTPNLAAYASTAAAIVGALHTEWMCLQPAGEAELSVLAIFRARRSHAEGASQQAGTGRRADHCRLLRFCSEACSHTVAHTYHTVASLIPFQEQH